MTATNDNTVLIAIGGNALVLDGEPGSVDRQLERAATFAESVAALVIDGWTAVVTHGNGPQVGYILRRGEPTLRHWRFSQSSSQSQEHLRVPPDYQRFTLKASVAC